MVDYCGNLLPFDYTFNSCMSRCISKLQDDGPVIMTNATQFVQFTYYNCQNY